MRQRKPKMKRLLSILQLKTTVCVSCLFLLSACTTTPLRIPYPTPPDQLMEPAPELQVLPEDNVKLSDAEKVIAENYGTYHLVVDELNALQNWVKQQKDLNP